MLLNPYRFGNDPYFSNVTLLLHADGTNGSTTIVDSSLSARSSTLFGAVALSTASPKFGTAALRFNGSGDALLMSNDAGLTLTGDFTIELFFYSITTSPDCYLFNKGGGAGIAQASYGITMLSGLIYFYASHDNATYAIGQEGGGTGSPGYVGTVSTGSYHHVAITRQGNVYRGFLDGVQNYTQTIALTPYDASPRGLAIGGGFQNVWGSGGSNLNGGSNSYIDEFRITNGFARYTAAFTPPAAPFPNY